MDSQTEPRLAGDLEGVFVVTHIAETLIAGHAETGHQPMPAGGGKPGRILDRTRSEMAHARYNDPSLDARCRPRALDPLAQGICVGHAGEPGAFGMIGRGEYLRVNGSLA